MDTKREGKPRIVVLEGFTTNPGDISWEPLSELGDLTVYDRTTPDEVALRAGDADIILPNKIVWTKELLEQIPRCRLMQLLSTGFNVVDLQAARDLGITVCNVPAYSTPDVVQHVFALILETTNHVARYAESVRDGDWVKAKDFTYLFDPLTELSGKTLGIIGMGSIGQGVARVALAFGMEVVFENPHARPQLEGAHCTQASRDELLGASDVVTLHCPASAQTTGMVNAGFLGKMRRGARLVNTARGALVNSADVAAALESGQLSWYAADVAEHEPMAADDPLMTTEHAIITPHVGWATTEARERLVAQAAANVRAFLDGAPVNVVN